MRKGRDCRFVGFSILIICLTYIRYRVMYIAPIDERGKSGGCLYMKQSDEKRIEGLWLQGYGSKKIANELGINVNTVKSFCRRHGLSGDRQQKKFNSLNTEVKESRCKYCGSFVARRNGAKKKIFCSDRCRMKWWNSHQELVNRKAEYGFACQNCGRQFTAYGNKNRKYCSHRCYIEHRYNKKV